MKNKYQNIKKVYRDMSFEETVGCTQEELVRYLESKFTGNMTWKNYGLHGWHIDHIIPLSRFKLSQKNEIKSACHYTNLQPLWAKDNLKKSNKLNWSK